MEKELNSFDLDELEDIASAVMIQSSMLSFRFIRHGVFRLYLSRDVRYLLDDIIEQYSEQQLSKSKAIAAIEQHHDDLMEQKQQLNIHGIEFVADAMAQPYRYSDSAHQLCATAANRYTTREKDSPLDIGDVGTSWEHTPNARRFLLFYYVAKDQFRQRLLDYNDRDEVKAQKLQEYYDHIIRTSPVVMTPVVEPPKKKLTIKERLEKQRLENYLACEAADARRRYNSFADKAVGGVKQVANEFIADQRAMLAEYLVEKNVFKLKDKQSGEFLTSEEVAQRYREVPTFDISPQQQEGADMAASLPYLGSALTIAELAGSRGRNLPHLIKDALKDARSAQEAIGQLGGQHAMKKLGIKTDNDFINRYHGPDFIGRDGRGRLTETEFKGYGNDSKRLSTNKSKHKQGSDEKNRTRAKQMSKKTSKTGQVSNRQGGAYTEPELQLWNGVRLAKGKKQHIASFTNTDTGRVKAYAQDKDGNLTELLVDEVIPDFQHKKAAIEQVLPTK